MSSPAVHAARPAEVSEPAGEASALSISVVESEAALAPIEGAWRALGRTRQFFVGPEWTRTWLAHKAPRARPFVLVASDASGAVVGLLPLARVGGEIVPCGVPEGAAHVDVVAAPRLEAAVASGVLAALRRVRSARVRLLRLSQDGALFAAVAREGAALRPLSFVATTCPYVRVERGWDGFLRGLSKHARHEARRQTARFFERPGARVRWIERPEDCAAGIGVLFDLHRRRFETLGKRSAFSGEGLERFHVALAQAAAAAGRLVLGVLEEGGTPVACAYGFHDGDATLLFQTGMAPEFHSAGAGAVLRALLLRDQVAAKGRSELDLLDGCSDWKARWAAGVRPLHDVTLFPAGLLGSARRVANGSARRLRSRVSRLLHGTRCPGRDERSCCSLPGCPLIPNS